MPVYQQTPGTAGRVIEGKAAIVTRDNKLHILNAVGTRVWELCSHATSPEDVVTALVREFDVDTPTAEKDCETFLSDLVARGILTRREA